VTQEQLPLHDQAEGRIYDRWPGESWRTAALADLVAEVLSEAVEDMQGIVPAWQQLQQMALMFGWNAAKPPTTDRSKALLELWLRWTDMVPPEFLNGAAHPELLSRISQLAAAYERRQAPKASVPGRTPLILPT
jgi:hypothetical protein